jgi:hypothetical protein
MIMPHPKKGGFFVPGGVLTPWVYFRRNISNETLTE